MEFTNPDKTRYSSDTQGISYSPENNAIKEAYKPTINYRVGGEFRYKIFRARAGYGVQASTYASDFNLDNSIKTVSGGVGVRLKKFFADFALLSSSGKNIYNPYAFRDGNGNPEVFLTNKTVTGMVTFGFTF